MRKATLALAVVSMISAVLTALPAGAQVTHPLTSEEVRCDADRLEALLSRSDLLVGPGRQSVREGQNALLRPVYLLETFASADGELTAVAYTAQQPASSKPERHLWSSLGREPTALRRNPAQPQAAALRLSRNNLNSDLLAPTAPELLTLVIHTSADGSAARPRLEIDTARPRRGVSSDTKLAGGLAGIAAPCHAKLTPADLHVLDVLAKTVRFQSFLCCGSSSESPTRASFAVLFRGEGAVPIAGGVRTTYRMDVTNVLDGRLAVEIVVDLADDGTLGDAVLRVLPACTAEGQRDCSLLPREIGLQVIKPVPAGQLWEPEGPRVACAAFSTNCMPQVSFSFAERLAGTDWVRTP